MSQASPSTFRDLYQKYLTPIFNYVYYRVGRNREVAEDLTSEIFLKALEKFETFNPETSSFQSWIYTVAHHHLIDHYRTSRPTVPLEKVENKLSVKIDLGARLDRKQELQLVLHEMEYLPVHYREILTLKYVSTLSNQEISNVLQKNPGSVRVTLHRAQEALKKRLHVTTDVPDTSHEEHELERSRLPAPEPAKDAA